MSYALPVKCELVENVASVSAGEKHAVCVSVTNEAYSWGSNLKGQLGH